MQYRGLKIIVSLVLMVCIYLLTGVTYAKDKFTPLPADEAFTFSATFIRPNVMQVDWKIAPHYYLYADSVNVNFTPHINADITLPKGIMKKDDEHGMVELFSKELTFPISLNTDEASLTMSVSYQGCSQDGFCYPVVYKNFTVDLLKQQIQPMEEISSTSKNGWSFLSLLTDQHGVKQMLQTQGVGVIWLVFILLGLLLAFTPCVLPMIPILTSIIVGQDHVVGTRKAFFLSLSYVLGMAITYAAAGFLAASLGSSIQVWLQKPLTISIVSAVFVLLGVSMFGWYELRLSHRWHNRIVAWSNQHEGGTYLGVFFMGVLSTLVVSPCVTAPLVGVLIYIGQTGNQLFGAGALFLLGIGMGLPLLLIGSSAGRWLPKSGAWMKAVKELFGIFMIAMGVWLISRIVSGSVTLILFGLLFLGAACFVGFSLPKLIRLHLFNRAIGSAMGIIGLLLVAHGINTSLTQVVPAVADKGFIVVTNLSELKEHLQTAQANHQPVILDFYADWCPSCVMMDHSVFQKAAVQQQLEKFMLIRVDLTQNTSSDTAFMKQFDVIAPPTILFFNNSGQEVNSRRIVGELSMKEFLSHIESFKTASCDTKVSC